MRFSCIIEMASCVVGQHQKSFSVITASRQSFVPCRVHEGGDARTSTQMFTHKGTKYGRHEQMDTDCGLLSTGARESRTELNIYTLGARTSSELTAQHSKL